jgi:hypothetical protein
MHPRQIETKHYPDRENKSQTHMNMVTEPRHMVPCYRGAASDTLFCTPRASSLSVSAGTHPHWGLWRRIFFVRRSTSKNALHDVGGAIISVRP